MHPSHDDAVAPTAPPAHLPSTSDTMRAGSFADVGTSLVRSSPITRNYSLPSSSPPIPPASMTSVAGTESPNSSYPTSPATRFIDSPPTTPSQGSSSEELSKKFVDLTTAPHRNLLQERLALKLNTSSSSSPRMHTRSSSYSAWSTTTGEDTSPATPLSARSASSVLSTASSMFERMVGDAKKAPMPTTVQDDKKSSMGLFTPVSAKTAAGSLRRNLNTYSGGRRPRTMSGLARSERRDVCTSSESDDTPVSHQVRPTARRATTQDVPSSSKLIVPIVCMTHSSFQAPSVLDSEYPVSAPEIPSPFKAFAAKTIAASTPRHAAIPSTWLNASSSSSASAVAAKRRSSLPPAPPSSRAAKSIQKAAFPALDPTLAALEKSCRLKSKVQCVACGATGWDFPKDRLGRALCSRECRISLKAREQGSVTTISQEQALRAL